MKYDKLKPVKTVNGITILRVNLFGDDFLKTVEVAFSAVAVAAFILKLIAHLGVSVLSVAARVSTDAITQRRPGVL